MLDWNEIRVTSSAPVRICDLGGWTDTWFAGHGIVWSIAVSPRVEVDIQCVRHPQQVTSVRIHAKNYAEWMTFPEEATRHPMLAAAIAEFPPPAHCTTTITVAADMPPGASTGTSAAVLVALIAALREVHGLSNTPSEVARLAHLIESDRLGMQSGIQDQMAAAYGGINTIIMPEYPHAHVEACTVEQNTVQALEERLILLYLGRPHQSSHVHEQVIHRLEQQHDTQALLEPLRQIAHAAPHALQAQDWQQLGELMQRNTAAQRALHPELIGSVAEDIIAAAPAYGIVGWKVNGAGGDGGSLTLLCSDADASRQQRLIEDIRRQLPHIQHIPVRVSHTGVQAVRQRIH